MPRLPRLLASKHHPVFCIRCGPAVETNDISHMRGPGRHGSVQSPQRWSCSEPGRPGPVNCSGFSTLVLRAWVLTAAACIVSSIIKKKKQEPRISLECPAKTTRGLRACVASTSGPDGHSLEADIAHQHHVQQRVGVNCPAGTLSTEARWLFSWTHIVGITAQTLYHTPTPKRMYRSLARAYRHPCSCQPIKFHRQMQVMIWAKKDVKGVRCPRVEGKDILINMTKRFILNDDFPRLLIAGNYGGILH